MEKKNLAIIILAIVLAASGIGNIILAITAGGIQTTAEDKEVLKVVRTSDPVTFDPIDSWDSASNDVLTQCVEPLIFFDYVDLTLKPMLATSWEWDATGTEITFYLRENVFFHDGAPFTADDVKHTFDRLNYFGNSTGTLPADKVEAFPSSIYKFGDGTPIIEEIQIVNDFECVMVLSSAFAPIEGLLAYTGSCIVSESSTPADEMIDLSTDLVIGTGPFKMVNYEPNSECRFERFDDYWRIPAFWDEVVYVYYDDAITADQAMLALDVDYRGQGNPASKAEMIANPDVLNVEIGVGTVYRYVTFNSLKINMLERKAISHAYNYTFHLQDILEGTAMKANSIVPPGFPGYNSSVVGGTYDIPAAREFMQAAGHGVGWAVGSQVGDVFTAGADEALWTAADFLGDIGFRRHPASSVAEQMLIRFTEDMDVIGIVIVDQPMTWADYIQEAAADPSFIGVCYTGWGPDYFETFNMIDPLVNPASASNFAQIDITEITDALNAAAAETDTETRYALYELLQYLVIDKYAVHMPTEYEYLYAYVGADIMGVPWNINEDLYWYPTFRAD